MLRPRQLACFVTIPTAVLIAGCGVAEAGTAESDDMSRVEQPLSATLPPNVSQVTHVAAVAVNGCLFTIGTAIQAPPYPPTYLAWIQMSSVPGLTCASTGYNVIGRSYALPRLAVARHPSLPELVASYSTKVTPSGSAHSRVEIRQISANDATITRSTSLAAMSTATPSTGNVYSGSLSIDDSGNMIVTGTFDGLIPGMVGTGTHYVAQYDAFVFETSPSPPAPNLVLAF